MVIVSKFQLFCTFGTFYNKKLGKILCSLTSAHSSTLSGWCPSAPCHSNVFAMTFMSLHPFLKVFSYLNSYQYLTLPPSSFSTCCLPLTSGTEHSSGFFLSLWLLLTLSSAHPALTGHPGNLQESRVLNPSSSPATQSPQGVTSNP